MAITAQMVKELREKTGAGMMDCKKALTETNGDMEKAMEALRQKGIASAEKKMGRIAAEGLIASFVDDNKGAMVEVNCESDFVAKNEEFKEFHGKYDCLYMPYDYEKNGNRGYAFINFVNSLHILLFYEKFNGKKWIHFESSKICELNMAHFQGFNEIQKHAKNFKELKKTNFSKSNENMVIPSKYLSKLKKRFPKMKYTENKNKKEFVIKAFE